MKRIEVDGKFYRMRRGRLVEIPHEWVGQTVHEQTIRKRKEEQRLRQPNEYCELLSYFRHRMNASSEDLEEIQNHS